jgi:hypothetical protein
MEEKIKAIVKDYNSHTMDTILPAFFTVMLWMSLQSLITEGVAKYIPAMASWQLSSVEVLTASYGLWWIAKKKNGDGKNENETNHNDLRTPPEQDNKLSGPAGESGGHSQV